jgi:hypothetical protein
MNLNIKEKIFYARRKGTKVLFVSFWLLLLVVTVPKEQTEAQATALAIPAQSDWVDHGLIFTHGEEGEWDHILWGGFAGCVTKKDGLFYLYYQGSDAYDEVLGEVTHRSIGVATSSDGINFQKYAHNPVITYSPNNNIVEGAVSCGVSVEGGEISMYYGANQSRSPTTNFVHANGMATTSEDGYAFTDQGIALNYTNSNLWGSGDEVFPVMSLKAPETNQWIVYYFPNGVSQSGLLGVAWGDSMLGLTNSAGVTEPAGNNIVTWGMGGGVINLQNGTYAVFTNNGTIQAMEARVMSPNSPASFSEPVQTYNFADFHSGTVYYDTTSSTWYLFYRNADASAYGVKTAVTSPSTNQAPSISAGQDATLELRNGIASAALSGTASDDGLPNPPGTLSTTWSLVSGPASVIITNPTSLNTTATIATVGIYIFELCVSDGELTSTDTVTITATARAASP